MRAFSSALDAIPLALAENSGLSPIETLTEIRSRHVNEKNSKLGIDCNGRGENGEHFLFLAYSMLIVFVDMRKQFVYDPLISKRQQYLLATQLVRAVLKIGKRLSVLFPVFQINLVQTMSSRQVKPTNRGIMIMYLIYQITSLCRYGDKFAEHGSCPSAQLNCQLAREIPVWSLFSHLWATSLEASNILQCGEHSTSAVFLIDKGRQKDISELPHVTCNLIGNSKQRQRRANVNYTTYG